MLKQFKQASVIIRSAWVRQINYRFTMTTYRIGELIETLVLILMWSAIYSGSPGAIKGFTLSEMVTYVLVGNIFSVAVRNFLPSFVSRDINEGRLSMFLVKPISYIKYVFLNELGRASFATFASVVSQSLVVLFFLDKFVFNTSPAYIALILVMMVCAFIIELLIGFLIGAIAFWTDEVDGMQSTIDRIKRFFSGGYFPLTLLPAAFFTTSFYLPFAYSFFIPAQLYLKKIDLYTGMIGVGVQICWIAILSIIVAIVWNRGLRKYEASGS